MSKTLYYGGDIITLEKELYAQAVLTQDGKMIAGLAAEIENQSHAIVRHARSADETPQTQVRISA
ncbi:MAG: hypothetical protein RR846_10930, partial [Oscillospiraceae bacterium]